MPATPSSAQSEASRQNGARSAGPATEAGKARAALNGVRHGLCGRTFFLLPDEDPAEFQRPRGAVARGLAPARPARAPGGRGRHPRDVARGPRRPAGGGGAERPVRRRRDRRRGRAEAAKTAAFKALGTLLRYRGRIEREHGTAMAALESLRQRRLARPGRATERTRAGLARGRSAAGCRPHRCDPSPPSPRRPTQRSPRRGANPSPPPP